MDPRLQLLAMIQAYTEADDEGRVDQSEQQEHLRLQLRHQLGLPRGAFEKPRAHDADADARTQCAEPDHEADSDPGVSLDDRQCLHLVHLVSFLNGGCSLVERKR